jgi:hypothetical protein
MFEFFWFSVVLYYEETLSIVRYNAGLDAGSPRLTNLEPDVACFVRDIDVVTKPQTPSFGSLRLLPFVPYSRLYGIRCGGGL